MLIAVGSLLAVLLVASAAAYAWRGASNAAKRADASAPSKTESAATSTTVAETETLESAAPTIPVEQARVATISVTAVGDMIFDRKVKALVQSAGGLAPLRHVASILDDADITVGNLESPLSSGGTKNTAKDVTFRGDPRGIESLKAAGFDFLSLGNNHVLDYGPEALADTVAALDTAGIGYAGAGADRT
ncbi:MAG: CapA family protein, partial [Coriobacteriia bacterium]|nr:CapA family protein [Coriobacteriia bacterium]